MIAEAAAGSMMDEEQHVEAGDVHTALESVLTLDTNLCEPAEKHNSTASVIPHATTVLAH